MLQIYLLVSPKIRDSASSGPGDLPAFSSAIGARLETEDLILLTAYEGA